MHCWNCGTRNPDENSFCGRCGKRIASTAAEKEPATLAAADAVPLPTNPLVEEPRAVHDSPRGIPPAEVSRARTSTITAPPEPPRREALPPLQMSRPSNSHRITGPSFLGLSDESAGDADSDYLLYDDEPERSSWRGWLALAVLVLLGFLVYKQWNAVSAGAQLLAQRATGEAQQATPAKPAPTVTDAAPTSDTSQTPPANGTTPQTPADGAAAKKDDSVNKPEADHTTGSAAESNETAAAGKDQPEEASKAKSSDAAKSKDESIAADTVSPAPSKEAKKQTSDDEDSREGTPAKAATKATTPAESPTREKSNDVQVEEAQRYLTGQGVRQDCGRAISLLRSSAREGNPRAQVKLGALYATGQCVTQDRAAAYEWLARAQETQPHNNYLQRTMSSLWTNMTPEERSRITK